MKLHPRVRGQTGGIISSLLSLLFIVVFCAVLYFARGPLLRLAGGGIMTSSITKEAADELGLEVGKSVLVVVKASDVMIAVD